MRLGVLPAKLDLEGMEIEFSLAVVRGGRPAFKYTSAEESVNIIDPSAGEFQITVPEGETRKWKSVNTARHVKVIAYPAQRNEVQ